MFLLLSVVLSLVIFPLVAAGDPHPQRGLKRALLAVVVGNFLYLLFLELYYLRHA